MSLLAGTEAAQRGRAFLFNKSISQAQKKEEEEKELIPHCAAVPVDIRVLINPISLLFLLQEENYIEILIIDVYINLHIRALYHVRKKKASNT